MTVERFLFSQPKCAFEEISQNDGEAKTEDVNGEVENRFRRHAGRLQDDEQTSSKKLLQKEDAEQPAKSPA